MTYMDEIPAQRAPSGYLEKLMMQRDGPFLSGRSFERRKFSPLCGMPASYRPTG